VFYTSDVAQRVVLVTSDKEVDPSKYASENTSIALNKETENLGLPNT